MSEIIIPILALGVAYIVSNQKGKKEKKENKCNRENFTSGSELPNTSVESINYPSQNNDSHQSNSNNSNIEKTSKNYTNKYFDAHQTTDEIFFKSQQGNNESARPEIQSLTGNNINVADFDHNNMVPYFGARIKGSMTDKHLSDSIFDYSQGLGSQHNKKVEQAPLFTPSQNMTHKFGAPNANDFIQSRQIQTSKISNVLPADQIQVGPGIGMGYTANSGDGYNSGMMNREAWMDKGVNELRTINNPKETFNLDGHEGPAMSKIANLGIEGKINKNRPDTDFELGKERWFTTTGVKVGHTSIPETIIKDSNRKNTSIEYYGATGNKNNMNVSYTTGKYKQPSRPELPPNDFNHIAAQGRGSPTDGDYGINSYNVLTNNRQVSNERGPVNNFIGNTFKAMVSPVVDVLRPTRKENVIGNINQSGYITTIVPNLPITNPNDMPKRTIKEMTSDKIGTNYLNISQSNNRVGAHHSTNVQVKDQERNTGDSSTMGFVGGDVNNNGPMDNTAWKNQYNNVNKGMEGWAMSGGLGLHNPTQNIDINNKETDLINSRVLNNGCTIQKPADPTLQIPTAETFGKINMPEQYSNQMNMDRMNPDILSAFKSNPYTQSLNSY